MENKKAVGGAQYDSDSVIHSDASWPTDMDESIMSYRTTKKKKKVIPKQPKTKKIPKANKEKLTKKKKPKKMTRAQMKILVKEEIQGLLDSVQVPLPEDWISDDMSKNNKLTGKQIAKLLPQEVKQKKNIRSLRSK